MYTNINLLCRALKQCLILQLAAILLASVCLFSCGKKEFPVPPHQPVVPAVKDLSYNIEDGMIVLIWKIPKEMKDKGAGIKGFVVHRAKQKIPDGDCRNCPVNFKPVAELPAEKTSYSEPLEKGFKYVFKVVVLSNAGIYSSDSNYAEIIN